MGIPLVSRSVRESSGAVDDSSGFVGDGFGAVRATSEQPRIIFTKTSHVSGLASADERPSHASSELSDVISVPSELTSELPEVISQLPEVVSELPEVVSDLSEVISYKNQVVREPSEVSFSLSEVVQELLASGSECAGGALEQAARVFGYRELDTGSSRRVSSASQSSQDSGGHTKEESRCIDLRSSMRPRS